MTSQQKRRFTLALNGFCRAKALSRKWDFKNFKFNRLLNKATAKLYDVADSLKDLDLRKCTCPARHDHTVMGHLPDCGAFL